MEHRSEISGAILRTISNNEILELPTIYPRNNQPIKLRTTITEPLADGRMLVTVKETILTIDAANHEITMVCLGYTANS